MRAERFLEGGSSYSMDVDDADRYREPFLESMMPGKPDHPRFFDEQLGSAVGAIDYVRGRENGLLTASSLQICEIESTLGWKPMPVGTLP